MDTRLFRFQYQHRPHRTLNANMVHKSELQSSFNIRLAVWLTAHVGTMYAAYLFALIGIGSLVGIFTGNIFLGLLFGSISSYFLQLVLLPVIMVAQNVQSRHQEILAEEQFKTTQNIYHDIEQMRLHLEAQDSKLEAFEADVHGALEMLLESAGWQKKEVTK